MDETMAGPKSQESSPQYDEMLNYDPPFRLLKEARKSWDHIFSDKVVYSLDPLQVALNSKVGVTKDYLKGHIWIECHITFQAGFHAERYAHYTAILEACNLQNTRRQTEIKNCTVARNPHVLVDVAHFVKTPKEMALDGCGIPSVIRLKRFDNCHCLCGYTLSSSRNQLSVDFLKNRELRVPGVRAGQFCKAPDKLIERRPEVVKGVPRDKGNPVGSVLDLDSNAAPLIFRIILGAKLTGFRFAENIQLLPQSVKVFLRPGSLKIGVSQIHDS